MKKIKFLIIAGTLIFFTSCVNETSGGGSADEKFPSDEVYYTVPGGVESLSFPSSANGKKCFVIYSNEKSGNQYKTRDTIKFNIDDKEENRSAENEPEIKVYEKAVKFSDGFYRDEIQFNRERLPKVNMNNSRAARAAEGASEEGSYNTHENSKYWVYSQSKDYVSKETFNTITLQNYNAKHCRLWFCNNKNQNNINIYQNQLSFDSLAKAFDTVFEEETLIFGSNGVDGSDYAISCRDGQIIDILVYDIFGDAKEDQKGGVFGYFRPADFYLNKIGSLKSNGYQTSNECQVICVDSHFLQKDQENNTNMVESTIIHEFQHLLNFCNKSEDYDTWFTEMLAMSAEDIFQHKIGLSDDDSPKSRFVITFDQPYKGFKNWPEDTDDENVYYCYANAYAFGAYLMRNYGGIELIHEIATNEYIDEAAITNALYMLGFDENFESVFQKFGMVYIFTDKNTPYTLNKDFTENYNGVNYKLTGVDLTEYPFTQFKSETELLAYVKLNLYYDENTQYRKDVCCLLGPRIFNSKYIMTDPIQTYGFTVFYAGKVTSGKILTLKRKSNLSVTVVVK